MEFSRMRKRILHIAALALFASGCTKPWEIIPYEDTGLPLLEIETEDGKGVKDIKEWKKADIRLLQGGDPLLEKSGAKVKGRGNSSWTFPKKPFDILLKKPAPVLGMPEANRWCVLANWRDATLMRNAVSLEIARMTALEWTPQGRFVDVVMDGTWEGNFYLTERVAPERLDVYPGGFMVCIDSYYDARYRFKTGVKELPVNIIVPEGCALEQSGVEQIRKSLNAVENALYNGAGDWRELLDEVSFCDWYIVHELTGNDEPTKPHGVYLYRHPDGKICAGPAWDFDFHTYRTGVDELVNSQAVWFDALLKDEGFKALLKERWLELKPIFESEIPPFIDDTEALIAESAVKTRAMWPIYRRSNDDETLDFASAVERLRENYLLRIQSLDHLFDAL